MEDPARYRGSMVYQDSVGARLFVGNQYSTALFLGQFAQETYCEFSQAVAARFRGITLDEKKNPLHMAARCDFAKNVQDIWT